MTIADVHRANGSGSCQRQSPPRGVRRSAAASARAMRPPHGADIFNESLELHPDVGRPAPVVCRDARRCWQPVCLCVCGPYGPAI